MGFWRWLFGYERRLTAEERALRRELQQKAEERRVRELYITFIRELLADHTSVYGFTMKVQTIFETFVLNTVAQYATRPYTIYRTSNEDMDYEGLCNIHVAYIQFPIAIPVIQQNKINTT